MMNERKKDKAFPLSSSPDHRSSFIVHHFLFFLVLLPVLLVASPGYNEPWGKDADLLPPNEQPFERHPSILVKAARQAILFHQNILTQVDGPRSHFRPSSSQYMLLAMYKHGFVKGFFL